MSLVASNSSVSAAEILSSEISKLSGFPFKDWTVHLAPSRITLSGAIAVHDDIGRKLGDAKFTIALLKNVSSAEKLLSSLDVVFSSPWDEKMSDQYELESQVKDRIRSFCSALFPSTSSRTAPVEQIPLNIG